MAEAETVPAGSQMNVLERSSAIALNGGCIETTRAERFYVPTDICGTREGCRIGLAWLDLHGADHAGEPLVVTPSGGARSNPYVARALETYRSETASTYRGATRRGWPGGPALLFFPTASVLDWFDRSRHVTALGVVQGVRYDPSAWAMAFEVEDLTTGRPFSDGPHLSEPVLQRLDALQRRADWPGMSDSAGITMTMETLSALVSDDRTFEPVELEAWALSEGWRPSDARRLRSHGAKSLRADPTFRESRAAAD